MVLFIFILLGIMIIQLGFIVTFLRMILAKTPRQSGLAEEQLNDILRELSEQPHGMFDGHILESLQKQEALLKEILKAQNKK